MVTGSIFFAFLEGRYPAKKVDTIAKENPMIK
jgi:hypothetical protein